MRYNPISTLLPLALLAWVVAAVGVARSQAQEPAPVEPVVIEDFEDYPPGVPPHRWMRVSGRRLVDVPRELDRDRDYFEVVRENGRSFVRIYTSNESTQVIRPNGDGYKWNLGSHPILQWEWRALKLPDGARETDRSRNDSGAALYVTFSRDWLGRPRVIKYVYSSTLPVGTVADYGRLRVLVVSSGTEGLGEWKTIERDVVADYQRIFGGEPPAEPLAVMLWSDSDDTESVSEVNFDNIVLLPGF